MTCKTYAAKHEARKSINTSIGIPSGLVSINTPQIILLINKDSFGRSAIEVDLNILYKSNFGVFQRHQSTESRYYIACQHSQRATRLTLSHNSFIAANQCERITPPLGVARYLEFITGSSSSHLAALQYRCVSIRNAVSSYSVQLIKSIILCRICEKSVL